MKTIALIALVGVAAAAPALKQDDGYCITRWFPRECGLISDGCTAGSNHPEGGYASQQICEYDGVFDFSDDDMYCVTAWHPHACGAIADGNCLVGSAGFETMEDCDPAGSVEDTVDGSRYCVTAWWPRECEMISEGNCVLGSLEGGYETETECVGEHGAATPTPEVTVDASRYCVTQWWPRTCAMISEGECVLGSPDGGYETETDCVGEHSTPTPEADAEGNDWCVTQWWPRTCAHVDDNTCIPGYTVRYESEVSCVGEHSTPTPEPTVDGDRYCVTRWWPRTCAMQSMGECVMGSPDGGYETEADCVGEHSTPTPEAGDDSDDGTRYCVDAWFPRTCSMVSEGNCVTGFTITFDTEADCVGEHSTPTPEADNSYDGWCVSLWWPKTCVRVSSGNCLGWVPFDGQGHETESACLN